MNYEVIRPNALCCHLWLQDLYCNKLLNSLNRSSETDASSAPAVQICPPASRTACLDAVWEWDELARRLRYEASADCWRWAGWCAIRHAPCKPGLGSDGEPTKVSSSLVSASYARSPHCVVLRTLASLHTCLGTSLACPVPCQSSLGAVHSFHLCRP